MRTGRYTGVIGVLAACGGGPAGAGLDAPPGSIDAAPPVVAGITIVAPAEVEPALRELVALTPFAALAVELAPAAPRPDRLTFTVVLDLPCRECFELDPTADARAWMIRAGDRLGSQYGVAAALEHLGFRFRHPFDTRVPEQLVFDPDAEPALGIVHAPETPGQRGLQLHTLHPIEAYFALWAPDDDEAARRIFDWIIKNRGNYAQWPALDDIMAPARHAAWATSTAHLIELAHARGLEVGLSAQIFGRSNLQRAFDLSDDTSGDIPFEAELAERLPLITDGLAFDAYSLSFGEFFGADPDTFIAAVNLTTAAVHAARPGAEVHASIHVGGDLRVDYNGENLPYYFLVKFADPSIVPNLHTVMFYNLFEDAGGAYEHDDFFEHRDYLIDQLRDGRPAVYYPESAYWIAFDNSVPLYLPTYVRSRWLDLAGIRAITDAEAIRGLDGHLVFSSGWEWGYWLNDYASLRASFTLPASHAALIADAFGDDLGPAAAAIVAELADQQATALIDHRLAPYLAGRDALIDAGDVAGIHSQPDRVLFAELAFAPWTWTAFEADVITPLAAHAAQLAVIRDELVALGLPDSRWSRELIDGASVTAARAAFVVAAYRAVLAHARGNAAAEAAARAQLDAAFADGTEAVDRRHADLHAPTPERWTGRPANATVYGFGYLFQTDSLCYWRRERAELAVLLDGATQIPPTCAL